MFKFGIFAKVLDENRKFFIKNCIQSDTPRMEATVFPEGLTVQENIPYAEGKPLPEPMGKDSAEEGQKFCNSDRILDLYIPEGAKDDEIFLLIHGGAFVYGCKELDKEFGMHLALKSGITVANINYRLFPRTDLQGQLQDIFYSIGFLCEKGYKTFHTTGDSAGGYHCLITAILLNSEEGRKECGIEFPYQATCKSTSPICGDHKENPKKFAGCYFDPDKKMPSYIYDLGEAAKKLGCPPTVLTTGDQDMMLPQNEELRKKLQDIGIPVEYYCAVTTEENRPMHHVYAIAHPTWPEGIKTIDLTIENAKR